MWCKGSRVRISSFARGRRAPGSGDAAANTRGTNHAKIENQSGPAEGGGQGEEKETGTPQGLRVDEGEVEDHGGLEKVLAQKEGL